MDAISGGASVLTFVELAGSLAVRTKQLYDFWSSVEEAPEDIQSIARDIHLIKDIIEEITEHDESNVVRRSLEECQHRVLTLQNIVSQLEPGFESRRRRVRTFTAIKAVFRKGQIKKIQESISATKQSLSLALQTSHSRQLRLQSQLLVQELVAECLQRVSNADALVENASSTVIAETSIESAHSSITSIVRRDRSYFPSANISKRLQLQTGQMCVKRESAIWHSVFGTVNLTRKTLSPAAPNATENGKSFTKLDLHLRPSKWLKNWGVMWELYTSLFGPTIGLQACRIIPNDSEVFKFCKNGDVDGVRKLLSRREASVWDTNEDGETALHVAAEYYQVDVCKCLIEAGAQATRDNGYFSPFTQSLYGSNWMHPGGTNLSILDLQDQINTQRALLETNDDYIDEVLIFLNHTYHTARVWPASLDGIFCRALLQSSIFMQNDLQFLVDNSEGEEAQLVCLIWKHYTSFESSGLQICTAERYDELLDLALVNLGCPSVFHACVLTSESDISRLLEAGANPHIISRGHRWQDCRAEPIHEERLKSRRIFERVFDTPTSLAMYTSSDFFIWRDALRLATIDLGDFIEGELKPGRDVNMREMPLLLSGWSRESLKQLFDYSFVPSTCEKVCGGCRRGHPLQGRLQSPILKQPKWMRFLWFIKHRKVPTFSLDDFERVENGSILPPKVPTAIAIDDPLSEFCFPGHRGCYVCEACWERSRARNFWLVRDTSPEEYLSDMNPKWEQEEDEDDFPFLFSLG